MGESRRLIASIHDVGPRAAAQAERLAELFEAHLGGPRFAMLVVPDHWGEAPLRNDKAFCTRLRAWADQGVEMFVHGWFHRDDARHAGLAAFKARHMTASEGEFLGLSAEEAARRMSEGRALIEDVIGRPTAGFIAPAWLYGPGARAALASSGFPLAEDHLRVWRPADDATLSRSPVITWASRSPWRAASSIAFAGAASAAPLPFETLRLAVHPGDLSVPGIVASIERTLARLLARRTVARYADLLPGTSVPA